MKHTAWNTQCTSTEQNEKTVINGWELKKKNEKGEQNSQCLYNSTKL